MIARVNESRLHESQRRGEWPAIDMPELPDPALDRCGEPLGRYPVDATKRTDRLRAIVPGTLSEREAGMLEMRRRRERADYSSEGYRIAERENHPRLIRKLNREARRQWRNDNPMGLSDRLLLVASAAATLYLLLSLASLL